METLRLTTSELKTIAELLMGAAFADGEYDGHEAEAIGEILRELASDNSIPDAVSRHLAFFDLDTFSVEASASTLRYRSESERAQILAVVSRVIEADEVHDLAETEYLRSLAEALEVSGGEIEDLTIELVEASEGESVPPPLPIDVKKKADTP